MGVVLYARVSTKDKGQDTENQLHQLRAFAERPGTIYNVFTDQESGGKADRTEFRQLLLEAYQKKFDLVVFQRLDRFSREGALVTVRYLKELKGHGVNYKSFTEPSRDSLGPVGDVIVSLLAPTAAQNSLTISANTKAALAKKRAAGVHLGTPRKSADPLAQVRRLEGSRASTQPLARELKRPRWPRSGRPGCSWAPRAKVRMSSNRCDSSKPVGRRIKLLRGHCRCRPARWPSTLRNKLEKGIKHLLISSI